MRKVLKRHTAHCPLCQAQQAARFSGYRLDGVQGLFPPRGYASAHKVYTCRRCGLVYTDQPAAAAQRVFEQDDSLLPLTGQDAAAMQAAPGYTDVLFFLKHKAKLAPGANMLDIGSGIGRVVFALRQAGYRVMATEPKKELFDYSLAHRFTEKSCTLNQAFDELVLEPESFDFIFLEPLNHFSDPHAAIQKTLGWLKPGGYLQLEVVNSRWLYKNLLALFYKLSFRKHVPYTSPLRKPFHACEYSATSFKVYCRLHGLELSELNSHPCDTYISGKWLNRPVEAFMRKFHRGAEISVILKK